MCNYWNYTAHLAKSSTFLENNAKQKGHVVVRTKKPYSTFCLFVYLFILSKVSSFVVERFAHHMSNVGLDVVLKQHLIQHS